MKGECEFLHGKAGCYESKGPSEAKYDSKSSSYGEVSLHYFYLGAFFLVCDGALGVTADRSHDENKHDPIEDGDKDKWHDHADPKWPLSCSAAV